MAIPVFKPSIKRRDMDAVLTCMVSDSLGPGSISRSFVSELAKYLELHGGVAVRDYRRAIEIAVTVLGLGPGDHVLISPLSPAVYYEVFLSHGIVCVFPDVEEVSPCVTQESVAVTIESLGEQTLAAAVLETTLGFAPILEDLGVPVIEDISSGLGGHNGQNRNGNRGDLVILAAEPEGIITAGGGSVVLAGSRKWNTQLRQATANFEKELLLPDMNSALGLTQVREIEGFVAKRSEIAQIFVRAMMRSRHKTPVQPGDGENVFFSFPVVLRSGLKDVAAYARKSGVETGAAFSNSILGRYGEIQSDGKPELANARTWLMRCILFPLYPTLTKKDRELVAKVLGTLP